MIYGLHAVAAAWSNPQRACHQLYLTAAAADALADTLHPSPAARRPSPTLLDRESLDALCPPGAVHQGAVLAADALPARTLAEVLAPPAPVVMLDQVSDPQNLGAILRTAAAFGACALVVPDRQSAALTAVATKVASGAAELVPVVRVTNLVRSIEALREAGYWMVGLAEEEATPLQQIDLTAPTALVMGAEGEGLRRLVAEACDHLAKLPTRPPLQSLNVATATAIALYEVVRQSGASTEPG